MSAVRQLAGQLAGLVKTAIWNWLATWFAMIGVGLACGGVTWWWLSDYSPWCWGLAVVAFVECLITAGMLAGKRGITSALVQGIERLGIGRATVSNLLDQVEHRFTTDSANSSLEIPPAGTSILDRRWSSSQLQEKLQNAVASWAGERTRGITGWMLSRLQTRLIRTAESVIGQRAKQSGAIANSGVTLRELRSDLESNADRLLTSRFRSVASRSTWLILGVLFVGLIVQGLVTRYVLGLFP